MTFVNTQPHAADALSLVELDLYHLIMDYRAEMGLEPIPLSLALTTTAGRHAADTAYNIWQAGLVLPTGANLHSWSDAPYYGDHSQPQVMWDAPERIGTGYTDYGFEISAAGYGSNESALAGWKASSGHNQVIVNQGAWANWDWNAIGIGVITDPSAGGPYGGRVYHVWFGRTGDAAPDISGTAAGESIAGTAFDDTMLGRGGRDRLAGGDGDDILRGQGGGDRLTGGAGDDVLTGGARIDRFVFAGRDWGRDRVTDYDGDIVVIRGEVQTRAALDAALSERNGNVIYDMGGDGRNVIVFEGIDKAALDLDHFVLI
ncbi:MAG: hypothetical protein KDK24_04360 [Pseudooceanicola sp.]|nr:hypothetical protein [Pseudooceanicola sp.]